MAPVWFLTATDSLISITGHKARESESGYAVYLSSIEGYITSSRLS